jgi:uncharacterized protein YukE
MDSRIVTDPDALERLKEELKKLSETIQEVLLFIEKSIDKLGEDWKDAKFQEFVNYFHEVEKEFENVLDNNQRGTQVVQEMIERTRAIENQYVGSDTSGMSDLKYLAWDSRRIANKARTSKIAANEGAHAFLSSGIAPTDDTLSTKIHRAVANKVMELEDERRMEELLQKNIADLNKETQNIRSLNEQLKRMKDGAERIVLQEEYNRALQRHKELVDQIDQLT